MAMISNPKVKFMDEPSTGLDPIARRDLRFLPNFARETFKGCSQVSDESTQRFNNFHHLDDE